MPRILLFSGKGGVGKTTVAAATGLASARRGSRVLVLSLDLAHSLSDAFGLDRTLFDQGKGQPTRIADNLEIQEIDVQQEVEDRWHDAGNVFSLLLASSGIHDALAEDLVLMPGMEDLITLLHLNRHAQESRYDLIVIDCPPTGDSLRFISMPKTLEWYVRKRFGITPGAAPGVGSADSMSGGMIDLYRGLIGVDALLQDSTRTSVRLVTTPERVVLRETQRAFMYFSLYGLVTDRIVANRIFPRSTTMAARNRSQKTLLFEMDELFAPVPVSRVPFYHDEVIGQASLARLAADLYGKDDPGEPGPSHPSFQLEAKGGKHILSVSIPFTTKSDVTLHREGEHLIVRIGSFKRHIPLPRELLRTQILQAKVDNGKLRIEFDRSVPTG